MLSEVTCSLQGPQGQVENILETFVDSFKLGVTNTAGLIVAFWVFVFGGGGGLQLPFAKVYMEGRHCLMIQGSQLVHLTLLELRVWNKWVG